MTVLCPPHLEQWQDELLRFHIQAELVLSTRLSSSDEISPERSRCSTDIASLSVHRFHQDATARWDFILKCLELVIVDEAHGCTLAGGVGHDASASILSEELRRQDAASDLVTALPQWERGAFDPAEPASRR
jgi:hypothetical protein